MNTHILSNVFLQIDAIEKDSMLIFFKGFGIATIKEVFNKYDRFYDGEYIKENSIDLEELIKHKKKMTKSLLSIEEGTYCGIYEEFLTISNQLEELFDGEVIIVENNYFDNIYPINYTSDILNQIERYAGFINSESIQDADKEIKYLSEYVSDINKIEDEMFITYIDRSEEVQATVIKALDISNISISLIEAGNIDHYIEFSSSNMNDLLRLKLEILKGNIESGSIINILAERSILKNNDLLNSIKSLICYVIDKFKVQVLYRNRISHKEINPEYLAILKKYWGSNNFRVLDFYENPDDSINKIQISQGELIQSIVEQVEAATNGPKYRDIFITAPTGAGKSVLFQVPAIYSAEIYNLITIVLSPLKALMVDQVRQLKEKGINYVEYINSDLSQVQKEEIINRVKVGEVSILYISPEFLLAYDIRTIIGETRKLGLLVIDEAHLVTTWGRDFRVDYWYLGTYIKRLRSNNLNGDIGNFVIASFTATAVYGGNDDMVYETIDSLYMKNPIKYLGNTRRTNIGFKIENWEKEYSYAEERQQKTINRIIELIKANKKAIVYAPYRRHIDELMELIPMEYATRVVKYYGTLDAIHKDFYEEKFRTGEANIMLATKAFGMGVDISDIEVVYHHAPTGNLCDYVQEIGRAGRTQSSKGVALQDFNAKYDLNFSKILYGLSSMRQYQLKEILKKLYSIYKQVRRRNFLINAETFSYLFQDEQDYENKIKNALLLLEKDLEKRYAYPVLIVRPKSLFSKAYAAVPSSIEKKFLASKYSDYAKKISEAQSTKIYGNGNQGSEIVVTDIGPIYEFDLKKLWEDLYSDISFPMLKKNFYSLELFDFADNIVPRYKLAISLNNAIDVTTKQLEKSIESIIECFESNRKGFFTRDDFAELIRKHFNNEAVVRKVVNTFIDLFIIKQGAENKYSFIQKRTINDIEEFRIINRQYHRTFRDLQNRFVELCKNQGKDENILCKYLAVKQNDLYMILSYVLEAFSLGSYEVKGGESPEIFIRINDPSKIRSLGNDSSRYSNTILKDIKDRQRRSSKILEKFFTELDKDETRWDFIEEYFLGKINVD